MKDMMQHKGYVGSVHYSDEDEVFYGKLEFIRALVTYEGTSVKNLKKAFIDSVEDYLQTCEEQNIVPDKPFKGMFNIRATESLHRKAFMYANTHNLSLNQVVVEALHQYLKQA